MSENGESRVYQRMQEVWGCMLTRSLLDKCKQRESLSYAFVKTSHKVAEEMLKHMAEDDVCFENFISDLKLITDLDDEEKQILEKWKNLYTLDIHHAFVKLPEGRMSACLFFVAMIISFNEMQEFFINGVVSGKKGEEVWCEC